MAEIAPGKYTVRELLEAAGFDINDAGADYLDGAPDHRRVTVGGLGFDHLEQTIVVPPTADQVEVTLDGSGVGAAKVTLNEDHQAERAYSFSVAADADEPNSK